jgi:hypothetical protein
MKNETIVDRVVERLKAQPLGDLITEEDLHEIVKSAIPKVFFERRKIIDRSGYNNAEKEIEPAIVEIMRALLQDSAKQAVQQWMVENADTLADNWRIVFDAGLIAYVQKLQDEIATRQIRDAVNTLLKPLNDERMKQGMPMVYL